MKAIILAGGFGTRLRSVVSEVPKPMAPLGGRPYLSYLIEYLKYQGITEIILSVHYLREQITGYFHDQYMGITIKYAVEDKPLGTGGAIVNSLKLIDEQNDNIFVLNGDTFVKADYRNLSKTHQKGNSKLTIALRRVADCSRYGEVIVTNNSVTSFNHTGSAKAGLINAGLYVIDRDLFDNFSVPEIFSFEKDFMFPNISELKPNAFITDDYFIDIGIPDDYRRAETEIPQLISAL